MNDTEEDAIMEDATRKAVRWVPTAVVLVALGGFFTLAWYAYHSGQQSLKEEDLLVVEADKTPIKEKPLDPGGMKFPNQDKTIFNTFSANGGQTPPKVERVLPAPEEPMPKEADLSETKTWVNEKLQDKQDKAPDAPASAPVVAAPVVSAPKPEEKPVAEKVPEKIVEKPVEKVSEKAAVPAIPAPVTPVELAMPAPKPEEAKPSANKEAVEAALAPQKPVEKPKAKDNAKSAKVQLGAYRSEKEAREAWKKIQKKYPELADKTVYIVKADLGGKGVYYRLRAGGLASAADAKSLCNRLSAKGQACLVP